MMRTSIPQYKFFICLIALAGTALTAGAQQVISLQKAVELTLANNLTIKQSQFNETIADANLQQAKNNRLPNLTAGPQASFNFGRSVDPSTNQFVNQSIFGLNGSISSQVLLFEGGLLKNQILENKLLLDVDKSQTAKIKNDLTLSVITTYLSVLSNQDLLRAAIDQVTISKQTIDKVQKNFDVGNNTLADLSQAKATVSTNQLNQTTAQNNLDISLLSLKQFMEIDPATPIAIERPDISKLTDVKTIYDAQAVFSAAVNANPDVRLAVLQRQATEQNVAVAKSSYYPSLAMFGSLGSNYSNARKLTTILPGGGFALTPYPFGNQISDNFNQAIGLSLNIPIFGRYVTRTTVRKAQINLQISQISEQLAKNNLNKTIAQAVLDLRAADKKYASAQQTYQSNKDAFNITQERYNVGLVNSLDYNTSQSSLNNSQFNMILAKYELVFRSKIIDYYLGNPITL
jgi:outer membrane protein